MPSVKFESNGGSSYDNECSYCDAVSFNDARLHELAPILIIALQLKYVACGALPENPNALLRAQPDG
jgi:hypothetical protein